MSQAGKKTSGFLTGRKLLPRVKQCLSDRSQSQYIDIDAVAEELRKKFPEYRRKKLTVFRQSVQDACNSINKVSDAETVSVDTAEAHQSKRMKRGDYVIDRNGAKTDSDFSEDNDKYEVYQDKNAVNNSITSLYVSRGSSPHYSDVECKSPLKTKGKEVKNNLCDLVVEDLSGVRNSKKEVPSKSSNRNRISKMKSDDAGVNKKKEISVQESSLTFADVGGYEKCLEDVCKLLFHMKHPEVYDQLGIVPPRGFLLHGPPGCGKTLLAHAIAGELQLPFLKIAAPEIVSGVSGESEEKIRDLFNKAVACSPCIVFIDEIDVIAPKRETTHREMEKRIVAQLLTCMDDLNMNKSVAQVFVIGASNRPDALDPALRRAGRFDREISMGIPDQRARVRILRVLCRNLKVQDDFEYEVLAANTPGFVGADLMSLTREAALIAVERILQHSQNLIDSTSSNDSSNQSPELKILSVLSWIKDDPPLNDQQLRDLFIELNDFNAAMKFVQPSAKREGFVTIPDVTWNDIGALHDVRDELQFSIVAPVKYPDKFDELGLKIQAGILLCGPPGCGKTLLAKAVANESGINFISVKGPELLNMYVGESERAVRQCFQRARNSAPCVIFFDELDALCPRRTDSGEGGASVRVVNQLLTEMDGLESRKQVFVMAATNRPELIDPAMLRPGRLDQIFYITFPDVRDREDILKIITKNGSRPAIDQSVSLSEIGKDNRCEGFTGADLSALVREASCMALKNSMKSTNSSEKVVLCQRDFEAAFQRVKPSVSVKDRKFYEKMRHRSCLKFSASNNSDDNVIDGTNN